MYVYPYHLCKVPGRYMMYICHSSSSSVEARKPLSTSCTVYQHCNMIMILCYRDTYNILSTIPYVRLLKSRQLAGYVTMPNVS